MKGKLFDVGDEDFAKWESLRELKTSDLENILKNRNLEFPNIAISILINRGKSETLELAFSLSIDLDSEMRARSARIFGQFPYSDELKRKTAISILTTFFEIRHRKRCKG